MVPAGVVLPNFLGGNSFSLIPAKKEGIPSPAVSTHFAPETWTMSSEDGRITIAMTMKIQSGVLPLSNTFTFIPKKEDVRLNGTNMKAK